jgi:hypothetical protein
MVCKGADTFQVIPEVIDLAKQRMTGGGAIMTEEMGRGWFVLVIHSTVFRGWYSTLLFPLFLLFFSTPTQHLVPANEFFLFQEFSLQIPVNERKPLHQG